MGVRARHRLVALVCVAASVLAIRCLHPDPGMRRASLLLVALGLGYGHQLGALRFARRRARGPLEWLLRGLAALTAGIAMAAALAGGASAWLLIGLAVLAAWHVLENDYALRRAGGNLRLPPLPRSPRTHTATVAAALLAVGAALLAPRIAPRLVAGGVPPWLAAWTPEEVVAVLLLYHAAIWLGRGLLRPPAARPGKAVARRAAIVAAHALPLVALAAARDLAPGIFAWLASPPIYLFLSAAHAVQTCLERGLEPA
jgi:hypothetical protein